MDTKTYEEQVIEAAKKAGGMDIPIIGGLLTAEDILEDAKIGIYYHIG